MQFAMRDSSKRPSMAFLIFTRASGGARWRLARARLLAGRRPRAGRLRDRAGAARVRAAPRLARFRRRGLGDRAAARRRAARRRAPGRAARRLAARAALPRARGRARRGRAHRRRRTSTGPSRRACAQELVTTLARASVFRERAPRSTSIRAIRAAWPERRAAARAHGRDRGVRGPPVAQLRGEPAAHRLRDRELGPGAGTRVAAGRAVRARAASSKRASRPATTPRAATRPEAVLEALALDAEKLALRLDARLRERARAPAAGARGARARRLRARRRAHARSSCARPARSSSARRASCWSARARRGATARPARASTSCSRRPSARRRRRTGWCSRWRPRSRCTSSASTPCAPACPRRSAHTRSRSAPRPTRSAR